MCENLVETLRQLHVPEDTTCVAALLDIAFRTHQQEMACEAFYDTTWRPDGRLALVVGEKPSGYQRTALFMTSVRSILQVLMGMGLAPAASIAAANEFLLRNSPERYTHINVFLGLLEPVSRSLVYAGVMTYPPLLRRAGGEIQSLRDTGPMLGLIENAEYEASAPVNLEPGDALLVYTEWLVDNWGGVSDGQQNVEASFARQALPNRSAEEVLAGLFEDFDAFDGRHAYADSLALVIKAPS